MFLQFQDAAIFYRIGPFCFAQPAEERAKGLYLGQVQYCILPAYYLGLFANHASTAAEELCKRKTGTV